MVKKISPDYTMSSKLNWEDLSSFLIAQLGLSQGTFITRRSRINIFCRWLDEHNQSFTKKSVEQFFYYLKTQKNLTNTSRNTYYHAFLSLQAYLLDRKLATKFMDSFRVLKEEDPNIIPLNLEEVKLIKNGWVKVPICANSKVYFDITIFLFDTGTRWDDARQLKYNSVDIIGQQIIYLQLKTKEQRIVHLEEPLLSILNTRIQEKDSEDLLFLNSKGGILHYSDYHKWLKQFSKALGIKKRVSPHIPRHTYAQNLYDQTGDIYLVKDTLGHKNIESTLRYLKNSGKRVKTAQQMHPHLADVVSPKIRIDIIEKEIERTGITQDEQFDSLKVKKAVATFVIALSNSVKISHLS